MTVSCHAEPRSFDVLLRNVTVQSGRASVAYGDVVATITRLAPVAARFRLSCMCMSSDNGVRSQSKRAGIPLAPLRRWGHRRPR